MFCQVIKLRNSGVLLLGSAAFIFLRIILLLLPTYAAFIPTMRDDMIKEMKNQSLFEETQATIEQEAGWESATDLFDFFQVALQTYLLLLITSDKFNLHEFEGCSNLLLKLALQFLAMSNFMSWLSGSFLEFDIVQEIPWNDYIFGKNVWTGFAQFTLPFTLFFRFHSVHMIVEVYIESWLHTEHKEGPDVNREPSI